MTDPSTVPIPGLGPLRKIFPGGQARPEDIVGRDEDIYRLWNRLLVGSCLLNEPRRIGKSSLLVRAAHNPMPPNWQLIHSSVQGVKTTDEFAALVLSDIHSHLGLSDRVRATVRGFLTEGEVAIGAGSTGLKLRGAFAQSPLDALAAALDGVTKHLADDGQFLVLAWDEFPDMVVSVIASEGETNAGALLGVLRRFREQNPGRIRWLLTGSVGLHHALRKLSSSGEQYVTDLDAFPLGPLTPDHAAWLAGCLLLGAGCRFDLDAMRAMAQVSDGIPYLMHLLAGWVRDHGPHDLSAGDVPGLFAAAIGDLDGSHQSTHLLSRLGDYYGDDTESAEELLDQLASTPSSRDELAASSSDAAPDGRARALRELLDLLDRDHYIVKDGDGRYRWRYDALRRIWIQRRS